VAIRRFKSRATAGRVLKAGTLAQLTALSDIVTTAERGDGQAGTLNLGLYTLTATVVSTIDAAKADILSTRTLYTVTGTYVVIAQSNARRTGSGYYGAAGAVDGTCYVPAAADVRFGTNVDATTGTCYVPSASSVLTNVSVDNMSGTFTGICDGGGTTHNSGIWDGVTRYGDGIYTGADRYATGIWNGTTWYATTGLLVTDVADGVGWQDGDGYHQGTFVGGIAPGDIVGPEWVVVGHSNYVGGDAGTYPTTATSQAAQLATDQAVVYAARASIKDDATILGQAGTYDFTAAIAAGYLYGYTAGGIAHQAADQAFLDANLDEMIAANDSIRAQYGCGVGTASGGGGGTYPAAAYVHSDAGAYGPTGTEYTPALSAMANWCLIAGIAWPPLDEVDGGRAFGPVTGTEYKGTGMTSVEVVAEMIAQGVILPGGTYTQTVTVTSSSVAVQGATVDILSGSTLIDSQTTNASGVALPTCDAGTYTLRVTKAGYTSSSSTITVTVAAARAVSLTAIAITAPPSPTTSTLAIWCYEHGVAKAGVVVQIQLKTMPTGTGEAELSRLWEATSDANGKAEFVGVKQSATYWIGVRNGSRIEYTTTTAATQNLTNIHGVG
jgi:hypothetical protein